MDRRDLFDVGARLIGVWSAIGAVDYARTIFDIYQGSFVPPTTRHMASFYTGLAMDTVFAVFLLLLTPVLVNFLYGKRHLGFEIATPVSDSPPLPRS